MYMLGISGQKPTTENHEPKAETMKTLQFIWTTSRARDTKGYNVCTLRVDGVKVAAECGGGYDMTGSALGTYIASAFAERLRILTPEDMPNHQGSRQFYGLTFHDPNYDPGTATIGQDADDRTIGETCEGKTVAQAEADGESLGLERYQATYAASSRHATERHTIPSIDGACGFSSVERIMEAIGVSLRRMETSSENRQTYEMNSAAPIPEKVTV